MYNYFRGTGLGTEVAWGAAENLLLHRGRAQICTHTVVKQKTMAKTCPNGSEITGAGPHLTDNDQSAKLYERQIHKLLQQVAS